MARCSWLLQIILVLVSVGSTGNLVVAMAASRKPYPPPFPGKNGVVAERSRQMLVPPDGWIQGDTKIARTAPLVEAVLYSELYPLPVTDLGWSHWGQGCLASDGCFYSAIGDHRSIDGNAFLYRYDPRQRQLTKVLDLQKFTGHRAGDYGHGKIHGRIDEFRGSLYFATNWDGEPGPEHFNERFRGGIIIRYDLEGQKPEHLGAPRYQTSYPVHIVDRRRGLMYLIAMDDTIMGIDLERRTRMFDRLGEGVQYGKRGLICDEETGLVYFPGRQSSSGRIVMYELDPEKATIRETRAMFPNDGTSLRAATPRKSRDGWFYCSTFKGLFFRFHPQNELIEELPNGNGAYLTSLALSPDDRFLYYTGGSCSGEAWKQGCPVIQYDIEHQQPKVLAFLHPFFQQKYKYLCGGTFGLVIEETGRTLYIAMNGHLEGMGFRSGYAFGLPAIFIVHIPDDELR